MNKKGEFVSPRDSLPVVREILSETDLGEDIIEKICYCIEFHEEYNWNGNNVTDANTLILQDADNLDAIGAIGIGREFLYEGAHNGVMYDESIPLDMNDDYLEDSKDDPSAMHHFYHKLFKLKDNMNTETARELAVGRTDYMRGFAEEFLGEWRGER